MDKKVFGPSKYFVPRKENGRQLPDIFSLQSAKSMYKFAIENKIRRADLDSTLDNEEIQLSGSHMSLYGSESEENTTNGDNTCVVCCGTNDTVSLIVIFYYFCLNKMSFLL